MDMVVGLTLYLLKQGYRPGDITVLTPYLKQLANIRVCTLRVDSTIEIYSRYIYIHTWASRTDPSYAPAYGQTSFCVTDFS